ncbi:uncharacterized protein N7459_005018 [Penicillium hispanicum]|uniref:uncharacterized protein n=1 Tax=Penicillium hispanicum TaxID=1080232 RepID=UPI002542182B|nr:uncharacterized protein N7459_005018 [Penicillium hispanicum]KAJ5585218.1 hypothetical protein N7459_005018 [Penicillium hispanicum]
MAKGGKRKRQATDKSQGEPPRKKPQRSTVQTIRSKIHNATEKIRRSSTVEDSSLQKSKAKTKAKAGPPRSWPKQDPPITDITKIPKEWEWSLNEPDLHESDIEGNIQRCHERIETGILPKFFEIKLEKYEKKKALQDEIASTAPGYSFEVCQRLHSLDFIKESLEKKGDRYEQLPNVYALIKAYQSGNLDWYGDKVTFWSQGRQIGGVRDFDWDEFEQVASENNGEKGFWVEGVYLELRVPGYDGEGITIEFLDDTGSSCTSLWDSDVDMIRSVADPSRPYLFTLGPTTTVTANGLVLVDTIQVNLRVLGNTPDRPLSRWVRREILVFPDNYRSPTTMRMSGSWWRELVFSAYVPNNRRQLLLADSRRDLIAMIENADPGLAIPGGRPENPPVRRRFLTSLFS